MDSSTCLIYLGLEERAERNNGVQFVAIADIQYESSGQEWRWQNWKSRPWWTRVHVWSISVPKSEEGNEVFHAWRLYTSTTCLPEVTMTRWKEPTLMSSKVHVWSISVPKSEYNETRSFNSWCLHTGTNLPISSDDDEVGRAGRDGLEYMFRSGSKKKQGH